MSMFLLGLWQHYTMFPYEYKMSVASDAIKQYSGFIMLLAVIFAGVTGVLMMHGGNPPSTEGLIPAMPNIMGPSNNAKNGNGAASIFNLGGNNAKNGNSGGIMGAVTNAFKPANNAKKNNNLASPSFKTV